MTDDSSLPPKASTGDRIHATIKAALSLIPVAGGVATELFASVVVPPMERRRQAWMEQVAAAIQELQSHKGLSLEDLQNNDAFIDCVSRASLIALRTHQAEKLGALRNAVVNSADTATLEPSIQQMFLTFIDDFNEWHIRILRLFRGPKLAGINVDHIMAGGLSDVIEIAFPSLKGKKGFYDRIWADLYQRGLITTSGLNTTMTNHGMTQKRTSDFGDMFLAFIAAH